MNHRIKMIVGRFWSWWQDGSSIKREFLREREEQVIFIDRREWSLLFLYVLMTHASE